MGALSLLAEAVEDASDDPEAVRRFAGRMHHEAARLTTLVNELIDLSRLQSDDPLSHAEVIAIDDLVAVAVDRGRLHAEAKADHAWRWAASTACRCSAIASSCSRR